MHGPLVHAELVSCMWALWSEARDQQPTAAGPRRSANRERARMAAPQPVHTGTASMGWAISLLPACAAARLLVDSCSVPPGAQLRGRMASRGCQQPALTLQAPAPAAGLAGLLVTLWGELAAAPNA